MALSFRPLTGMVCSVRPDHVSRPCFRPLTGMVQRRSASRCATTGFRPLTGIVPTFISWWKSLVRFRPLTGMVSIECKGFSFGEVFSPPCGDGIYNERVRNLYCLFFAPLRGLYRRHRRGGAAGAAFAPLRGLYPKYITKHRKTEEPDG